MLKERIAVLALMLFLCTGAIAACISVDEKEIELAHPTDDSLYFFVVHKDFSMGTFDHGVTKYSKATTKLAFKASSYTTESFADKKIAAKIILSEYNNTEKYTKVVDLTEGTVGEFSSYFIEFNDKETNEKGEVTAIMGPAFEAKTKVYIVELRAKDARYAQEKELYKKMLDNFSLSVLEECPVSEQPQDNPSDSGSNPTDDFTNPDNTAIDTADNSTMPDQDTNLDTTDNDSSNQGTNPARPNSGNQPASAQEPFKIFGFDGILVIAVVVLLLLLLAAGFVGLVIVAVVVYFFFIKKKR